MGAGLINMGAFLGAAVVQPLFGYILDSHWQGEMLGDIRHYPVQAFHEAMLLPLSLIHISEPTRPY